MSSAQFGEVDMELHTAVSRAPASPGLGWRAGRPPSTFFSFFINVILPLLQIENI